MDHLNTVIFKIRIRLGASCTLYVEQFITEWGVIKLVHDRIQYLTHSHTTTLNTLRKILYKSNKRASKAESAAFEVKKLVESLRN